MSDTTEAPKVNYIGKAPRTGHHYRKVRRAKTQPFRILVQILYAPKWWVGRKRGPDGRWTLELRVREMCKGLDLTKGKTMEYLEWLQDRGVLTIDERAGNYCRLTIEDPTEQELGAPNAKAIKWHVEL